MDVANRFGIARNRTQNFHNDKEGIELNYDVLSETVACFRAAPFSCDAISDNWGDRIASNFKSR
jgi:hypothetical protein